MIDFPTNISLITCTVYLESPPSTTTLESTIFSDSKALVQKAREEISLWKNSSNLKQDKNKQIQKNLKIVNL